MGGGTSFSCATRACNNDVMNSEAYLTSHEAGVMISEAGVMKVRLVYEQ